METQDRKILRALQKDARLTNQQLADKVGMSVSACWRRVRSIEKAGLISRYCARVDPQKAGFSFQAILYISLERHDKQKVLDFVTAIKARPEILECYATTGDADYHLKVISADIKTYNQFMEDFLLRLPGIRKVRSNVVLNEIKSQTAIPV